MREILFRGKRLDNGEWIEGLYANCHGPGCSLNETRHYIIEYPGTWHEVYTSTIGQCTGRIDRNGVRIFEGDIIRDMFLPERNRRKPIYVIQYSEDICSFTAIGPDGYPYGVCLTIGTMKSCTVIGNIYDNPELVRKMEENLV